MTTIDGAVRPEPKPTMDPHELAPPLRNYESPLPLAELDRALSPIRRMVSYATSARGAYVVRYLGANLVPYAARAMALDLPVELHDRVVSLHAQLVGLDIDSEAGKRARLADLFAILSRIDALTGLPIPDLVRALPKPLQHDELEAPVPPLVAPAQIAPARGGLSEPPDSAADAQTEREQDDDDGLSEFSGDLSQPIAELVPIELAASLAAYGIDTVRDLTLLRPRCAESFETIYGAGREIPNGRVVASGRIQMAVTKFRRDMPAQRCSVVVGAGPLMVCWADPVPEIWREIGERIAIAGTFTGTMLCDAEIVRSDGRTVNLGAWNLPDVPDIAIRALWGLLADGLSQVRDPLPFEVLRRFDLPVLGSALAAGHIHLSEAGRRRLAFDEVLLAQIAGILPRLAAGRERGISTPVLHSSAGKLGQLHDLVLYDDAQMHLEEIKRDLRRQVPMRRVLTGEVGAGKGRIVLLAAAIAAESKSQVLFVSADPAEIESRFLFSEPMLRDSGFTARLLPAQPTKNQLDAIKRGEIHIIFGPCELLEQPIEYRRLGLIIAIEREQFGRASMLHAALPAPRPDLLVLTSIPVGPRVLLTAYADHHVSLIQDPQRRPAHIELCRSEGRAAAYQTVRDAVTDGFQSLVVFPMVDGHDAVDIPGALRLVRALEADVLAGLRVGLLHGAQSREERMRVHEDFVHRRLDVLVSTTRVEDGPAIPSIAAVVLEQADRFDQWRLHRIIGYLSRAESRIPEGRAKAMLVVGEMAEPDASARIERVLAAPNGFHLTEALVVLRGIDRTVAAGHSPSPSFRWFDLDGDLPLLIAAREEAHRLLRTDATLRRGAAGDLANELRAQWDILFPNAAEQGWNCPIREEISSDPRRRKRRRRRKK